MLSVSNAITTIGLSSKVQRYIVQVSASLWLHGDKSWTPVNNILSYASPMLLPVDNPSGGLVPPMA